MLRDRATLIYPFNIVRIEKGITGMIEWVTAAPNAYLAIIGDGPMAEELKKLHGKENRVYCVPGMWFRHACL
jgi:hypothetical protein